MIGSQIQEAFNIRLEELNILDMCFLYNCSKPTLALLYEDTKKARHLRTYEVNLKEKARPRETSSFSDSCASCTACHTNDSFLENIACSALCN